MFVYCVSGLLGEDQEMTFRMFSALMSDFLRHEIEPAAIPMIKQLAHEVACLLERDGPGWLLVGHTKKRNTI